MPRVAARATIAGFLGLLVAAGIVAPVRAGPHSIPPRFQGTYEPGYHGSNIDRHPHLDHGAFRYPNIRRPRGYRYGDGGHEGDARRYGIDTRHPGDHHTGGAQDLTFRTAAYGRPDDEYFPYRVRPVSAGWLPGYLGR